MMCHVLCRVCRTEKEAPRGERESTCSDTSTDQHCILPRHLSQESRNLTNHDGSSQNLLLSRFPEQLPPPSIRLIGWILVLGRGRVVPIDVHVAIFC